MTIPSAAAVAKAKEAIAPLCPFVVTHSFMQGAWLETLGNVSRALDAAQREEKMCRVCLITPMECPVCVGFAKIEQAQRDGAQLACSLCHCCGEKRHDGGDPCVSCEATAREREAMVWEAAIDILHLHEDHDEVAHLSSGGCLVSDCLTEIEKTFHARAAARRTE